MNRSTKLRVTAAATFAVIGAAAYLVTQYAAAQKPASLNTLPTYPFVGSAYSIDDIAPTDRTRAEAQLRRAAGSVVDGYQPVAERFMAVKGDFIWDAVRTSVGGYLARAGFDVQDAGQHPGPGEDTAFIVWERTNRLQRLANPGKVVAIGLHSPQRGAAGDQNVHVYAYFELSPRS
ncbi:hypothetical protein [Mycobacterium sp. SMC-13]|uniref:hypothetical protein n=1 Tax=Mycobacterium sp. SMC-13 TaxID=3381626 RepID=UPI0038771537